MSTVSQQEMQGIIQMIQSLDDKMLTVLWNTISSNAGGISGMDPKMLQAFYEEFKKRPGLLESMTESKKQKKMKLTESQARRAIRKWLFEYATDSGVSHRMSTDDKIAGKLGDDREDQPASTIPDETPIVAVGQMATQLTQDMPPVEDPKFVPGTPEELGRSADLIAREVSHDQLSWFYEKLGDLAKEAQTMANTVEIFEEFEEDGELESIINPKQSSEESAMATNETFKRWNKILKRGLTEARSKKDPLNLRRRKLSRSDMRLYRDRQGEGDLNPDEMEVELDQALEPSRAQAGEDQSMTGTVAGGEYQPSQEDLDDMAAELGTEVDDLPGFRKGVHMTKRERRQAMASGELDGEARLKDLVDIGVYPKIRTMSGMRKKIAAEIDPLVQMWATAQPAVNWLQGFYADRFQLQWGSETISGPDIYSMALQAYMDSNKKNPAKLQKLTDVLESNKDFYKEVMNEIVMTPIIKKWRQEIKKGTIDVSSRKSRNNFMMSDWILETVLNSGFGKSGKRRRAKKVEDALNGMVEFKSALDAVASEASEDELKG